MHYRAAERLWKKEEGRPPDQRCDWTAVDYRLRAARERAVQDDDSVLLGACLELQGNRWEIDRYQGEALAAWGGALTAYEHDEVAEHRIRNCDRVKQLIRNWFDIPRVFVSYARRDVDTVRAVIAHLEDIGAEVLWDQKLFIPGVDLSQLVAWTMGDLANVDAVQDAVTFTLRVAGIYLVMWSRTYAKRTWTTFELKCALAYLDELRAAGRIGPRILIVRLDDHPLPRTEKMGLWIDLSGGLDARTRSELTRAVRETPLLRPRTGPALERGKRSRRTSASRAGSRTRRRGRRRLPGALRRIGQGVRNGAPTWPTLT